MSIESAKSFFIRLHIDAEFAEKVESCESLEEIKELVFTEGYEFTAEEIKEAIRELSEAPEPDPDQFMH